MYLYHKNIKKKNDNIKQIAINNKSIIDQSGCNNIGIANRDNAKNHDKNNKFTRGNDPSNVFRTIC